MLYVLRKACAWGALALFLNLGLTGCQQSASLPTPDSNYIQVTTDYPAIVEVILPGGSGLCTGTFIGTRAVLTAAHCALTSGAYTIVTSFGTFVTSNRVTLGAGVVNDPNDIAILWFSQDVASVSANQVLGVYDTVRTGDTLRLVGFGCDNIVTKADAGVKRTGTNVVESIDSYLNFITPGGTWSRGILGPQNRAGSCFGDSGGPALKTLGNGRLVQVGVAHAGGFVGSDLQSEYIDLTTSDNRNFLVSQNSAHNLGIVGL